MRQMRIPRLLVTLITLTGIGWLCIGSAAPDPPVAIFKVSFPSRLNEYAVEAIRDCCSRNNVKAEITCAATESCETIRLTETPLSEGYKYVIVFQHGNEDIKYPQSYSGTDDTLYRTSVMHELQTRVTCHLLTGHQIQPNSQADSAYCKHCGAPTELGPKLLLERQEKR
jgi:hypothetical protein